MTLARRQTCLTPSRRIVSDYKTIAQFVKCTCATAFGMSGYIITGCVLLRSFVVFFFFLFAKKVCSVCTGVKPYACSMCDMRFFQRYHLARHTLTHTGTCLFSPPSDLTMRRSVRVSRPHPNCQSTGTQTPFHCALPTRLCPLLTYFHCCGQVLFPVPGRLWVQA